MSQSNSGRQSARLSERLHDYYAHLQMRLRGRTSGIPNYAWLFNELDRFDAITREYAGMPLEKARVIEIGYGQRPFRLKALLARGVDAYGIDLDSPILRGSPGEFLNILRKNGPERFLKSATRYWLFDRKENVQFVEAMGQKGYKNPISQDRFLIGDAGGSAMLERFKPGTVDFVYSVEVFEHVPEASMRPLLKQISSWLSPRGVAYIRPNLFPGITGGHLTEWYRGQLQDPKPKATEPWEHLRKKRIRANTYLNEFRLGDYERLLTEHLRILDRKLVSAGERFLTAEIEAELSDYSRTDLLTDIAEWIVAPKTRE